MVKVVLVSVSIALGAAACASTAPPPLPPVWSANYDVPFDAMVGCLPQDGVAVISFTPSNSQAGSTYTIRKAGSGSLVIWRRPGNVGGLDWLDGEARTRADRCGNS